MSILQSTILGAIQGVTELLPISSSAHLVLFPYIFGWDYQGLSFDVALHFGTLLAIVIYFRKDWKVIITKAISARYKIQDTRYKQIPNSNQQSSKHTNQQANDYPKNLLWQILIASIPAALVGLILDKYIENYFHSPLLLAINLAVFGIILWLADRYSSSTHDLRLTTYKQTFIIGLSQAIALIPGVSRSGITMTAGRIIGFNREESARFSFLLGTPAILGAFIFKFKDISLPDINLSFIAGTISAALFGFLAIKYLLQYLKRGSFFVFTVYRVVLAVIVLISIITR